MCECVQVGGVRCNPVSNSPDMRVHSCVSRGYEITCRRPAERRVTAMMEVGASDWSVSFLFTSWWIWEEGHPVHCVQMLGVLSAPYSFVNFNCHFLWIWIWILYICHNKMGLKPPAVLSLLSSEVFVCSKHKHHSVATPDSVRALGKNPQGPPWTGGVPDSNAHSTWPLCFLTKFKEQM